MANKQELLQHLKESLSSMRLLMGWQHQLVVELQEATTTLLALAAEEESQEQ